MKHYLKVLCILLTVVFLTGIASAQSLEERLQTMMEKNAEMYVNPLVTAFGSGMNSGWFHSAKPHKLLGFDFGVRAMIVTFPDDQKTFNFDISQLSGYSFSTSISGYSISLTAADLYPNHEVPTFFGSDEEVDVRATKDQIVDLIEGQLISEGATQTELSTASSLIDGAADEALDVVPSLKIAGTGLEFLPLIVPQAAVGLSVPMLPIKAELVFRGIPEIDLGEDLGMFKFFGGGVKLALDPFIPIPLFPVNISVGAYTQKMTLGDVLEANNTLMSLMVGKDISLLVIGVGVYGAVGVESSNIKLKYDFITDDGTITPIKFDMKGENKFRTTVGARVRLAVFNVSADYSMGVDNVVTIGAGISIR
ncbi:MAG: hypothetical protein L6422_05110 [Candidatus Marinimicrobia bacterium]|nr:hypothetical protein [bacterium]MCG2715653.1 hypothetical protein [Candidatus Neomarinimicrobiota bacterium]